MKFAIDPTATAFNPSRARSPLRLGAMAPMPPIWMAIELKFMPISTQKYRATDISGDYAAMARAFGAYGERITTPDEIVPAIRRGIEATQGGTPALLEFITARETTISEFA